MLCHEKKFFPRLLSTDVAATELINFDVSCTCHWTRVGEWTVNFSHQTLPPNKCFGFGATVYEKCQGCNR